VAPVTRRLLLLAVLAAGLSAAPAGAGPVCTSADLRYPFQPGGPKAFGVFGLKIDGGSCTTAHRVAKAWMKAYEANIARGNETRPRSAAGFRFTTVPNHKVQELSERGTRGAVTVRFAYRIPSG
jgi:hypothetical protein